MQPYINPNYYSQYNPYQPAPQPVAYTTPQIAKYVQDFGNITVGDIPTNGTPAFFIKNDLSEIQSRKWTEDGRITAANYKIENEVNEPKADPFQEIMRQLEEINKKLSKEEIADE